jgi:hypothetical protein
MPSTSREAAPERVALQGYEGAFASLDGGYTVGFEEFTADADPAELFRGLPDDRCQSPHWGYVIEGRIVFRYEDREETVEAGQAYYAPPGHLPLIFAGTRIVEFSPSEEIGRTMEVITGNLKAAGMV